LAQNGLQWSVRLRTLARSMPPKIDEAAGDASGDGGDPLPPGGIAVFDYGLEAQGRRTRDDWSGDAALAISARYRERADLAESRAAIESAIEATRDVLRGVINAPAPNCDPEVAALVAQCEREVEARLESLRPEAVC
jgi:hypothetical protein